MFLLKTQCLQAKLPDKLRSQEVAKRLGTLRCRPTVQITGDFKFGGVNAEESAQRGSFRVNGVGRGCRGSSSFQPDFNQISRNPAKIWFKSGYSSVKVRSKSLEIMCFQAYPNRAEK